MNRIPRRMRFFCMAAALAGLAATTGLFARPTARADSVPGHGTDRPAGQATFPHPVARPASARLLAGELSRRDSATATLQRHCPVAITARLLDQHSPLSLQQAARAAMQAPASARLAIRHVALACGRDSWSEAWNLYLPARLDDTARAQLADGHTPFGKAVGERNFQRVRLGSHLIGLPPGIVLENHALLRRQSDGAGFSYLIERYTQAALRPAHDAAPQAPVHHSSP